MGLSWTAPAVDTFRCLTCSVWIRGVLTADHIAILNLLLVALLLNLNFLDCPQQTPRLYIYTASRRFSLKELSTQVWTVFGKSLTVHVILPPNLFLEPSQSFDFCRYWLYAYRKTRSKKYLLIIFITSHESEFIMAVSSWSRHLTEADLNNLAGV